MTELIERLRALRTDVELDSVFGSQTSTAEFKKCCYEVKIDFAKM